MLAAAYYVRNILTEIIARRGERRERRLVVHAGKARLHTAKVTRAFCDDNFLRIPQHSPYSPDRGDLVPSLFFLFGYVKSRLQGQQFESADGFLSGVREIQGEISIRTLEKVFREWINRLHWCIATLQQMESTRNEVNNRRLSD
jgi:hypothetical protein